MQNVKSPLLVLIKSDSGRYYLADKSVPTENSCRQSQLTCLNVVRNEKKKKRKKWKDDFYFNSSPTPVTLLLPSKTISRNNLWLPATWAYVGWPLFLLHLFSLSFLLAVKLRGAESSVCWWWLFCFLLGCCCFVCLFVGFFFCFFFFFFGGGGRRGMSIFVCPFSCTLTVILQSSRISYILDTDSVTLPALCQDCHGACAVIHLRPPENLIESCANDRPFKSVNYWLSDELINQSVMVHRCRCQCLLITVLFQ